MRDTIETAATYIYHPDKLTECIDAIKFELGPEDTVIDHFLTDSSTLSQINEKSSSVKFNCKSSSEEKFYLYDVLHALHKYFLFPMENLKSVTATDVYLSNKCFEYAKTFENLTDLNLSNSDPNITMAHLEKAFNLKTLAISSIFFSFKY